MFFAALFRFLPTHAVGVVVFVPQAPLTPPRNIFRQEQASLPLLRPKKTPLHGKKRASPSV